MIRLALIDGPLPAGHPALDAVEVFRACELQSPAGGHALALASTLLRHAPELRLCNLVVFGGTLATDTATVAAALAAAAGSDLALCAFGLPRDDPAIRAAVLHLQTGPTRIVAAAPARGGPVWPAALPGVIAVQGDARCQPPDWSLLAPLRFGACPEAGAEVRGASAAAAHLAGHLARLCSSGSTPNGALAALSETPRFRGPERRSG